MGELCGFEYWRGLKIYGLAQGVKILTSKVKNSIFKIIDKFIMPTLIK